MFQSNTNRPKRVHKKPDFYQDSLKVKKKRDCIVKVNSNTAIRNRIIPREDLLIWGRCKGFGWWPGRIANRSELTGPIDPPDDPTRWINWFGDNKYTETRVDQMAYFHDFSYFKESVYTHNALYHQAINLVVKEAAERSGRCINDEIAGIEWAKNNFYPEGYTKFLPATTDGACSVNDWMGNKSDSTSVEQSLSSSTNSPILNKTVQNVSLALKQAVSKVNEGILMLKNICLGCGSLEVVSSHPLFNGGFCDICQIDYRESVYLLDDQGYCMYCCVCGGGEEVVSCDNTNCGRCFCSTCLEALVDVDAFNEASDACPWICYICIEEPCHGNLLRLASWPDNLLQFMNGGNSTVDFEILPMPSGVSKRRPIRVLSLFDGIATGCLVLRQLGIKIECYHAAEIDHEAVCVAETRHPSTVHSIGDVCEIDDVMLDRLGPFDLVIGGSPCNDLSIVNPARKGIWSDKGSGYLFFEFMRILKSCQLIAATKGNFVFWMFENVVCMDKDSKSVISRFLQRNPVCLDASIVSPAHRSRYYWGNIPGMKRPLVASACHKLTVQECLEPGRTATVKKLRTITTKPSSVRRVGSNDLTAAVGNALVLQKRHQKDSLWVAELERIFGFPVHYTDVCNMARSGRLRLLGKSWSVPVIKHIFSPLKDHFASA